MNYWILDVYPAPNGMRVWLIDSEGRSSSFIDPWHPYFYLEAKPEATPHLPALLNSFNVPLSLKTVQKTDFFSGKSKPVVEVRVGHPLAYSAMVKHLLQEPSITLSNADLNLTQCYFYERGLFPLARCSFELNQQQEIQAWHLNDSPWALDYDLPPLRYAHLGLISSGGLHNDPSHVDAPHRRRGWYVLSLEKEWGKGRTYEMDCAEDDLIHNLNRHIKDWDPDILLTDWGDGYLMQKLRLHSMRTGIPLHLSRDTAKGVRHQQPQSFMSFGKMAYKAGPFTLFGRLHIDTKNSFAVDHTDLDGLFEIARVAQIPIQRAARATIGTSLSSMQFNWAVQNHVLIPVDKGQTEDFRTADNLLQSDRGGLVYEPEIGWHEDLIEFDFASMYPEIMIRHNVTPEAVNCPCCPQNTVPGISHHLCQKKTGMVPAVLKPIVDKRSAYKKLIKDRHPKKETFKAQYDAFKWALVTCFGYLGFRNARFGRIEAHECVNAFSREALLKAKDVAESEGFHFVHAIVDSLWLKKPGVSDEEVERLRQKIEIETGLPLGLEGRYRWIRFCPSKTNPRVGVPNRYFGVFTTGEMKIRGLELRRHDTPSFIRRLQEELLKIMKEAQNLNELEGLKKRLLEKVDEYRDRLKQGSITPIELAIHRQISKDPSLYAHDTLPALAAKKLAASGLKLHPGETIQYIVTEEKSAVKDWRVMPLAFIEDGFEYDICYYERLLQEALHIYPDAGGSTGTLPTELAFKKV